MFKEFIVRDVFNVTPVNRITEPNKSYIPDDEIIGKGGSTPYIAAISKNNGITGYSYREANNDGDCITISTTAASPNTVFYQPDPFIGRQQMSAFRRKDNKDLGYECGLYLVTSIRRLTEGFNYGNKLTNDFLKNMKISLPVIAHPDPSHEYTAEDIDWQYMRDRITELERDRITELDAYLKATGLDDYELTEEDKKVLSDKTVVFSNKSIGDLFVKVEAKCKKPDFDKRKDTSTEQNDEFRIPLINAKLGDNGIMFYGRSNDWNTQSMCIDVIQNGAVATGKVYAQPQPTAVLWDAYLIKPIKGDITENILLYFARCIEKLTKERFSYEKKATWDRIKECQITIPITSDGTPDFGYMEKYIRAMEKIVIADVVKYKDKVIETTKSVVA